MSGESGVASVGDGSSSGATSDPDPPEAEHTLVSLRLLSCALRAGEAGVAAALGVEPPPRKRPSAEAALVGGGRGPRRLVGGEKKPGGAEARVTTCGDALANSGVWCARCCGGGVPSLVAGEKRSRGIES